MCVIIVKPIGNKDPNFKTFKDCFNFNSDGAGYMLTLNNEVIIRKGFKDYDSFIKDYATFIDKNKIDILKTPIVYHFRISTQGGINDKLTHPYPVVNNYKAMKELKYKCDLAVAHNGIINFATSFRNNVPYNDTMTFIKDYLYNITQGDPKWYLNNFNIKLLKALMSGSHSKLAILSSDGNIELIGQFFKEKDGCYYSNLNHKATHYYQHQYFKTFKDYQKVIDEAI